MSTVSQTVALQQMAAQAASRPPRVAASTASGAATSSSHVTLGGAAAAVTYTDRIKRSGDINIDALLAGGNRWFHDSGGDGSVPSAVAQHTLTYSFISNASGLSSGDAQGFQALDSAQQQRVRDALATYSKIIDVSFTEVSSGGDLQYGANTQSQSAGYARYPNEGSTVMLAANQSTFAGDWAEGSYEWEVLLHETGHTLGLKHPGNYNAGGGGTAGPYLPGASDNRGNTVMSYNNAGNMQRVTSSGNALTKSVVNPSTLQRFDIAALQYLYGASQSTSAQTYSWDSDAAFSQTLWNPNSGSAIDLSNQSKNSVVDLRAGHYSSIAQRDPYADTGYSAAAYAQLKSGGRKISDLLGKPSYSGNNNLFIAAGSRFTQATGGSGNDSFIANTLGDTVDGGAGNDRVFWNGGDLTVDGGSGTDTVFVKKVKGAQWTLSDDKSTLTLARTDAKTGETLTLGTVSMSGVEAVRFWDGTATRAVGPALYTA